MIQRNSPPFWFVLALGSSLSLWEALGWAGDTVPVCLPGDTTRCAQPLSQGQPAPFLGQLLSPNLAIELGQKASFCDERLNLELRHAKDTAGIDLTLEKQLRGNDRLTWESERILLMQRLEEAKAPPPWYERPLFVAVVSVIITAALTYGLFELSIRTR